MGVVGVMTPFVLDLASNPHPRLLAGGLQARASQDQSFWAGYLTAMADATGCHPDDLEAWLDYHQNEQEMKHEHT